ncbi:MAG: hypothetical protein KDA96_05600 [Planctomycetaceae bacterium]|nr:hypothetical protein [Planctomycetaceae bacterium]
MSDAAGKASGICLRPQATVMSRSIAARHLGRIDRANTSLHEHRSGVFRKNASFRKTSGTNSATAFRIFGEENHRDGRYFSLFSSMGWYVTNQDHERGDLLVSDPAASASSQAIRSASLRKLLSGTHLCTTWDSGNMVRIWETRYTATDDPGRQHFYRSQDLMDSVNLPWWARPGNPDVYSFLP